jgi:hypothetical protein
MFLVSVCRHSELNVSQFTRYMYLNADESSVQHMGQRICFIHFKHAYRKIFYFTHIQVK